MAASGEVQIEYAASDTMAADIYTKGFTDTRKWTMVRQLINIFSPFEIQQLAAHIIDGGASAACVGVQQVDYHFVHACCEHNSLLCVSARVNEGVKMRAVRAEDDFNSEFGRN